MKLNINDIIKNIELEKEELSLVVLQGKIKKLSWILDRLNTDYGFLIYVLSKEKYLFYSLVSDSLTKDKYKYIISKLKQEKIIKEIETPKEIYLKIKEIYGIRVAEIMRIYEFTKLGVSIKNCEVIYSFLKKMFDLKYIEEVK